MQDMKNDTVMVSVLMLTYKQERYIGKAIESVVKQRTNFKFELVIGEDGSPDGTAEICRAYAEKYPDIIRFFPNAQNQGLQRNFMLNFGRLRGKYVAICEGDDFFLSRNKLQLQVDLLEAHPEAAGCFHKVLNYFEADGSKSISNGGQQAVVTQKDLIWSNCITNVSVMYRRGLFGHLPDFFLEVGTYDHSIHILNAEYGPFLFMNRTLAVYRQLQGSIWSGGGREKQILISMKTRELLMEYYKGKPEIANELRKTYYSACAHLMKLYREAGNEDGMMLVYRKLQWANPNVALTSLDRLMAGYVVEERESLRGSLFLYAKQLRRFISRFIPYPRMY